MTNDHVLLSTITRGTRVRIGRLPDGDARAQFIRIGLIEGATVHCSERLPGGTMVLRHARQEMAISRELSEQIHVSVE